MNCATRMVAALVAIGVALGPVSARADDATAIRRTTVAEGWSGIATCLSQAELKPSRRSQVEASTGFEALALAERERRALVILAQRARVQIPATTAADCTSSDCASRRLFDEERGPRLLRLAADYGFIAVSTSSSVREWTISELDEILAALQDMPANLMPLSSSSFRDLVHSNALRGAVVTIAGPMQIVAQSGDPVSGILINRGWGEMSPPARRAVLVHEVAHEFARARASNFAWRHAWRQAMDSDAATARSQTAVRGYVSRYALNNLDEDFAESATAYRYIPGAVRGPAPARYSLLKEWLFDGLDYGAGRACGSENAVSEQVLRAVIERAPRYRVSGQPVPHVISACRVTDPEVCAERSGFSVLYREHWTNGVFRASPASRSALEALMENSVFLGRALILVRAAPEQIDASGPRE